MRVQAQMTLEGRAIAQTLRFRQRRTRQQFSRQLGHFIHQPAMIEADPIPPSRVNSGLCRRPASPSRNTQAI